jgi:hypothetical protein
MGPSLGWFGVTDPLEAWMSRPGAWRRGCFRSVSNRPRKTLGYEAIREARRAHCTHRLNAPLVTGGPGSLVGATSCSLRVPERLMISVENFIGFIGRIAFVVYLFIALIHP